MQASIDAGAVTQQALAALASGEASRARDLLEQVVAAKRADAAVWLALAHARAALGDQVGKVAAIDEALVLKPNDLRGLLAKADHLAGVGDERGAASFYGAALQYLPMAEKLPAPLREGLKRAQAANERIVRQLEDFVRADLAAKGLDAATAPRRFATAIDILFGRKSAYVQQPRYLFYPELPQVQFYERAAFPWLDALEAETPAIRAELDGLTSGEFKPYVTHSPGRPKGEQRGMVDNPSWTALFLYKDGAEQPPASRCPRTVAALRDAPLTRIPARTPSILFSRLAPGAHIPPHTGMLNARLVVHLPLVVPGDCAFRVGNDMREWTEGKAWVFDDTIEHEAWNRSAQDRTVLLFDIWRPELSEEERAGVAALCSAIDSYSGGGTWDA